MTAALLLGAGTIWFHADHVDPGSGFAAWNLDPTLLLGPANRMLAGAADVLRRAGGRPGHIFNLGHGILPETPVEHVQALARFVHQFG